MEWPFISRNQHLRDVLPHHSELFVTCMLLYLITVKQGGRLSGRFLGFITVVALKKIQIPGSGSKYIYIYNHSSQ
jgi:hypothetical protein